MVEWVKPSLYFYSNEQVRIPVKSKNILECRGTTSSAKLRHSRKEHSGMPRNHQFREITSLKKQKTRFESQLSRRKSKIVGSILSEVKETEDQVRIPVKSKKMLD